MVKDKLRKLPCSPRVCFKLDQLLDSLEFSEKQVVKKTREIRRFCQTDPQNWRQLKNIRQLGGFLALVPTENSAGERTDRGSTIGFDASSSRLPGRAIRQDAGSQGIFPITGQTQARHLTPRVAIVAVACKLSVRISVVFMKQRPYEVRQPVHPAPLTQEETSTQGTTRQDRETREPDS
jgi:hypothetical protein